MEDRSLFEQRRPWKPKRRYYWIYRAKAGQQLEGVLLNHHLEEHLTHWLRGCSVPHIPQWQGCEGCANGWEPYRRWYSGLWLWSTGKVGLVELTEGALESCPRLAEPEFDCRGQVIRLRRAPGKNNGRCFADLTGMSPFLDKVPPPVNIGDAMMNILREFQGKQG